MSQIGFIYQSMATVAQASVTGLYANIDNINHLRQQLAASAPAPAVEEPSPAAQVAASGRLDITV